MGNPTAAPVSNWAGDGLQCGSEIGLRLGLGGGLRAVWIRERGSSTGDRVTVHWGIGQQRMLRDNAAACTADWAEDWEAVIVGAWDGDQATMQVGDKVQGAGARGIGMGQAACPPPPPTCSIGDKFKMNL